MSTPPLVPPPLDTGLQALPITDSTLQRIRQLLQPDFRRATSSAQALVKTLPTAPHDGDRILYWARATATGAFADVRWPLIYDALSTYWYPEGAADPMITEVDTAETTVSTAYANLATVGPRLTIPLRGDYHFLYGGLAINSNAGEVAAISLEWGAGPTALDVDNALELGAAGGGASVSRPRAQTISANGQIVTSKYRVTAGTGTFSKRFLNARPLRVR